MPLPDNNAAWPPKDDAPLFAKMDEWAAWWSGDKDQLIGHYTSAARMPKVRPSQLAGGIVGASSRALWGKPASSLSPDDRVHVPLASDIFQGSADLLFAEPPSIKGPDRITQLIKAGLLGKFAEGAEACAALGGVYLRASWDRSIRDVPFLSIIEADGAIPTFSYDVLRSVIFWWVVEQDSTQVWRHLEEHALADNGDGLIRHALYRGTADSIGQQLPLDDHPATANMVLDPKLLTAEGELNTGPGLAVVYVPNRTPNTVWRKHNVGRNLGQSDIARCEGLLDKLDRVFTNWLRDLDKAKGRIIAPDYMLTEGRPGEGLSFDLDRDVFQGVRAAPGSDGATFAMQVVQFDFDPIKYLTTCQEIVEAILRSAGYSAQTFGEDEDGNAMTATEVNSRGQRSSTTRDRKLRHWQPAVHQLVTKLLVLDGLVFDTTAQDVPVVVEFSGSTQETPLELATTAKMLKDAGAASVATLVKVVHPDWDETAIDTEVAAILTESGMAPMADPSEVGIVPFDDQVLSNTTV